MEADERFSYYQDSQGRIFQVLTGEGDNLAYDEKASLAAFRKANPGESPTECVPGEGN